MATICIEVETLIESAQIMLITLSALFKFNWMKCLLLIPQIFLLQWVLS